MCNKSKLFVQCSNGNAFVLEFEHDRELGELMVCDLKLEINDQQGIPTAQQHLIFGDQMLKEDGRRLASYNIQNESTIHLMIVPVIREV